MAHNHKSVLLPQ